MSDILAFLQQAWALVGDFHTLSGGALTAAIIMLLINLCKLSIVQPLWAKLGNAQVFVAPVLALASALVAVQPFSLQAAFSALAVGGGAIALHEILSAIVTLPGVNSVVASIAGFLNSILGGPTNPPAAS